MREVTKDTFVWNAEPQGRYNPYFVSKFHLDRGDTSAVCSSHTLLNVFEAISGDIPTMFGGDRSYGDGRARLGALERDDVCRKCVPVMP